MVFVPTTPNLGMQPIAETRAAQSSAGPGGRRPGPDLGKIISAVDPTYGNGEFIYLLGVASTVVGSAVIYNPDDYSTTLAVADAIGPVAIAMSANVASQYGWYQIQGKGVAKAGTVVDNANVYLTATPGQLDDAVVAGDRLKGAKWASADGTPSAGLAEIELWRPFVEDGVAV